MSIELISKYFDLQKWQKIALTDFVKLLLEWNKQINLISRKDTNYIWERHILHSLSLAKINNFQNSKIIDVGSGGGLPGIPLAIFFPLANFTLIDSIRKKINVVENIIHKLGLKNIETININSKELNNKYDFVIARAVSDFRKFYKLTKHLVRKGQNHTTIPNGILYLKGGEFYEEIKPFEDKIKIFNIYDYFKTPFFETKKVIYLPF